MNLRRKSKIHARDGCHIGCEASACNANLVSRTGTGLEELISEKYLVANNKKNVCYLMSTESAATNIVGRLETPPSCHFQTRNGKKRIHLSSFVLVIIIVQQRRTDSNVSQRSVWDVTTGIY